jgi:phosphatidylglycerol lysyltransferase
MAIGRLGQSSGIRWRSLLLKQSVPLLVVGAALPFILRELQALDVAAALGQVRSLTVTQWVLACVATAISFIALGRYDRAIHRYLRTGTSDAEATTAGMIAVGLSQTTGLGLITGSFARWRMVPSLTLPMAFAVTAGVSASFLACWAVVCSVAVILLPHGFNIPIVLPMIGIGFGVVLFSGILFAHRSLAISRFLPSLPLAAGLVFWIFLDLFSAALAFWILVPAPSLGLMAPVICAFIVAFCIGMTSGTPAGVGPFEVALLGFLPMIPEPDLVCAVLAFRLVYFLLPAAFALGGLAIGPARRSTDRSIFSHHPAPVAQNLAQLIAQSPYKTAELGLIHQGVHDAMTNCSLTEGWMTTETQHCLVSVFDPIGRALCPHNAVRLLRHAARQNGKVPAFYKVSEGFAKLSRQHGYKTVHISDDALITPETFDLSHTSRRQLRRKLRQADKAGVHVTDCQLSAELREELARIDQRWTDAHGKARGFSVGRFDIPLLRHQKLFVAYQDDTPIAFVTFHATDREWALDIMRHNANIPNGTMHALVAKAIETAGRFAVSRVSLSGIPVTECTDDSFIIKQLRQVANRQVVNNGLRQFKSSFAPTTEPRFLVTKAWPDMALAVFDIRREVITPRALPFAAPEYESNNKIKLNIMNLIPNKLRGTPQ